MSSLGNRIGPGWTAKNYHLTFKQFLQAMSDSARASFTVKLFDIFSSWDIVPRGSTTKDYWNHREWVTLKKIWTGFDFHLIVLDQLHTSYKKFFSFAFVSRYHFNGACLLCCFLFLVSCFLFLVSCFLFLIIDLINQTFSSQTHQILR